MVSFPDAVKMFFARYTDFQGRSRRSEYWWVQLFNFLVMAVGMVLAGILGSIGASSDGPGPLAYLVFIVLVLYALAVLIPGIALTVRRLHDVNITGWILLAALILFIGSLVGIAVFVISLIPGTAGPNKYGPDPKNPGMAADTFV